MLKRILGKIRQKGLLGTLIYTLHWIYEMYYEHRLGINTKGFISLDELNINDTDCFHYEPSSYASIFRALDKLPLNKNDVFIDFGSGKGRAVIAAATYPVKKVIGVELSEYLNNCAKDNFENAKHKDIVKCKNAEFVNLNAFDYEPENDISVVLLYNPFSNHLMEVVADKLYSSLKTNPRSLYFIFRYPRWNHDIFAEDKRFELVNSFDDGYRDAGETTKIYKTKA